MYIKFRVWDKARNKWLEETETSLHCFTNYYMTFDGRIVAFQGSISEPSLYVEKADLSHLEFETKEGKVKPVITKAEDRFVIQPSSGYSDIKKKEIFIGDIIQGEYPQHYTPSEYRELEEKGEKPAINIFRVEYRGGSFHLNNIQVVGNIFETPELLKNQGYQGQKK